MTCTRPDIFFGVGLVSRYMEYPNTTHLKVVKRILRYLKDTLDYGLFYSSSSEYKLKGYCDSNWVGDIDDRKCTTRFHSSWETLLSNGPRKTTNCDIVYLRS